jgi:hypothetical protein
MATTLQVLPGEGMWTEIRCECIVLILSIRWQRCPRIVPELSPTFNSFDSSLARVNESAWSALRAWQGALMKMNTKVIASRDRCTEFTVEFDQGLLVDLQGPLIDAIQIGNQADHDGES